MPWHVDNAGALHCNGFGLESLLAGHFDKDSVHWRGAWYVIVLGSVHWEKVLSLVEYTLGEQTSLIDH